MGTNIDFNRPLHLLWNQQADMETVGAQHTIVQSLGYTE